MRKFGLIGFPLSHSFSKKYFSEKFEKEGIEGCEYELYELENANNFPDVLSELGDEFAGLNVTIPHKQNVIPFLDRMDPAAERIGAVNVISLENDELVGYNSDYYGFQNSLKEMLDGDKVEKALVLGTGGASLAVKAALEDLGIAVVYVSRTGSGDILSYDDITPEVLRDYKLIVNASPVGMSPNVDVAPEIPYESIGPGYYLYDLVYNPLETKFMKLGQERGAKVLNGLPMLHMQAEKAWEIWNRG